MIPTNWTPHTAVLPEIIFRPAEEADTHALHQACYPELNFVDFRQRFERGLKRQAHGRAVHLLAQHQPTSAIIGTAHLWRYTHTAELADVLIVASWRNQGIGTALIMSLTTYAHTADWPPLEIGVESDNAGALRLYKRLGFVTDREVRLARGKTAVILRLPEESCRLES